MEIKESVAVANAPTNNDTLSEVTKKTTEKERNDLTDENTERYLDMETVQHSISVDSKNDKIEAKSQDGCGNSPEKSQFPPSVEISQYLDDEKVNLNQDFETEKPLSVIEEEKSTSTSISELIEAEDSHFENIAIGEL